MFYLQDRSTGERLRRGDRPDLFLVFPSPDDAVRFARDFNVPERFIPLDERGRVAKAPPSTAASVLWVVAAIVVVGVLVVGWFSTSASREAANTADPQSTGTAPQSEPQPTREEQIDQRMAEQGYEPIERGDLYYKYLDTENACSYARCVFVSIVTIDGCPGGIYVEGSIELDGGASVGMTNSITASLEPQSEAIVELSDHTGNGSGIRVTEANCLSG